MGFVCMYIYIYTRIGMGLLFGIRKIKIIGYIFYILFLNIVNFVFIFVREIL